MFVLTLYLTLYISSPYLTLPYRPYSPYLPSSSRALEMRKKMKSHNKAMRVCAHF